MIAQLYQLAVFLLCKNAPTRNTQRETLLKLLVVVSCRIERGYWLAHSIGRHSLVSFELMQDPCKKDV